MIPLAELIGTHDLIWITIDSLRYDVAQQQWRDGHTPTLASVLPAIGWQQRETPGTFTYPAHLAFLAGFLPTPPGGERAPRLLSGQFERAKGIRPETWVFEEPTVPDALAALGYHTACLGGVSFFSGQGALGSTIPRLFAESHWERATGPGSPTSAEVQADRTVELLARQPAGQPLFLLLNLAATHTPTHFYLPGATRDSPATQAAALRAVDQALVRVLAAVRRPSVLLVFSDHGDCFGEDGRWGHGHAHPLVTTVPYLEVVLE